MQYVSEKPYDNKNHAQLVGAGAICKMDWKRLRKLVLTRAADMQVGAQFIVLNFAIDEKGRYLSINVVIGCLRN